MKRILMLTILSALLSRHAMAQQEIVGKWWTPKKDAIVEIYQSGGKYEGKIISGTQPNRKDVQNVDLKLRGRLLTGVIIFKDFTYDPHDGNWANGYVYDPNVGKTYRSNIWLSDQNRVMNVRGFVGISLFGRTSQFYRVENSK